MKNNNGDDNLNDNDSNKNDFYIFTSDDNDKINDNKFKKSIRFFNKYNREYGSILTIKKIARIKLINTYNYTERNFNIEKINNIITNEPTHLVACFKDFLIYGDDTEFIQKYYIKKDIDKFLPKIYSYYHLCSVIFPNYVILKESKYIYKNIQRKQRVIDIQQEIEKKRELKSKKKNAFLKEKRLNNNYDIDDDDNKSDNSKSENINSSEFNITGNDLSIEDWSTLIFGTQTMYSILQQTNTSGIKKYMENTKNFNNAAKNYGNGFNINNSKVSNTTDINKEMDIIINKIEKAEKHRKSINESYITKNNKKEIKINNMKINDKVYSNKVNKSVNLGKKKAYFSGKNMDNLDLKTCKNSPNKDKYTNLNEFFKKPAQKKHMSTINNTSKPYNKINKKSNGDLLVKIIGELGEKYKLKNNKSNKLIFSYKKNNDNDIKNEKKISLSPNNSNLNLNNKSNNNINKNAKNNSSNNHVRKTTYLENSKLYAKNKKKLIRESILFSEKDKINSNYNKKNKGIMRNNTNYITNSLNHTHKTDNISIKNLKVFDLNSLANLYNRINNNIFPLTERLNKNTKNTMKINNFVNSNNQSKKLHSKNKSNITNINNNNTKNIDNKTFKTKSKEKSQNPKVSKKILNIFNLNTYKKNTKKQLKHNIINSNNNKTPLNNSIINKKNNGHTSISCTNGTCTATGSYNKTPTLVDKDLIKLNKTNSINQCGYLFVKQKNNIEDIGEGINPISPKHVNVSCLTNTNNKYRNSSCFGHINIGSPLTTRNDNKNKIIHNKNSSNNSSKKCFKFNNNEYGKGKDNILNYYIKNLKNTEYNTMKKDIEENNNNKFLLFDKYNTNKNSNTKVNILNNSNRNFNHISLMHSNKYK